MALRIESAFPLPCLFSFAAPLLISAGKPREREYRLEYVAELEPPELPQERPEEPFELSPPDPWEEPDVRPVPVEERLPPDPTFERVEFRPSPLDRQFVQELLPPRPAEPEPLPEPEPEPPREVLPEAPPPEPPLPPPGVEEPSTAPVQLPGRCPTPVYPPRAERQGIGGAVVLRITVGVDGGVVALTVEESSGHSILDRAALEAIRSWRFDPGTRGGQPEQMDVLKRLLFTLEHH